MLPTLLILPEEKKGRTALNFPDRIRPLRFWRRHVIEALIFDMDGLMIDSERLYFQAEREIAARFNASLRDETLWKMMGTKPIEGLAIFVSDLNLPIGAEEALDMRNSMMREKLKKDLVTMPGLSHILSIFHHHLKLAICTGAQREFLDIVVDRLEIREKFDVLQSSDGIRKGKPEPQIYSETCKKLGLAPEKCVVLEDSQNGVLAGKRAGCYVVAVPSEYTEGQNFGRADFIASDLFQAEKHISSILLHRP
jgi:HAD superfamily hydrolase (TIGR01509 family)